MFSHSEMLLFVIAMWLANFQIITIYGTGVSHFVVRKRSTVNTCSPGSFFDLSTESCTLCRKGMYQDKHKQTECLRCPDGQFQPNYGQKSCIVCPGVEVSMSAFRTKLTVKVKSYVMSRLRERVETNFPKLLKDRYATEEEVKKHSKNMSNDPINNCIVTKPGHDPKFLGGGVSNYIKYVRIMCGYDRTTNYLDIKTGYKNVKFPNIDDCPLCPKRQVYNKTSEKCYTCPKGKVYFNLECVKCYPGYYSETAGDHYDYCIPCPTGTYRDNTDNGSLSCMKCPSHTYTNMTASSACARCPEGSYQPQTGQTKCIECKHPGSISVAVKQNSDGVTIYLKSFFVRRKDVYNHELANYRAQLYSYEMVLFRKKGFRHTDCLVRGKKGWNLSTQDISNAAVIQVCCFFGCYQTTATSLKNATFPYVDKCTTCDKVNEIYNPIRNKCATCNTGHYFFEDKMKLCVACKSGEFQDLRNQTSCKKCPVGTSSSYEARTWCTKCFPGSYQPKVGSKTCLTCHGLVVTTTKKDDTLEVCLPSYYDGLEAKHGIKPATFHVELDSCTTSERFVATNCIQKTQNKTKFLYPIDTKGLRYVRVCCFIGCQVFPITYVDQELFPFISNCSVCSELLGMQSSFTPHPAAINYSVEAKVEGDRQDFTIGGKIPFYTKEYMDEEFQGYCEHNSATNRTLHVDSTAETISVTTTSLFDEESTRSPPINAGSHCHFNVLILAAVFVSTGTVWY